MRRYNNLITEVNNCKPSTIVEIGTWNARHAVKMIKAAEVYNSNIIYHGFDIFEFIDPSELDFVKKKEKITKKTIHKKDAYTRLSQDCPESTINLYCGYTFDTLLTFTPSTPIDFIYIDGGHSLETIENDWIHLSKFLHKDTVVLFDDCYVNDNSSGCFKLTRELKNNSKYIVEDIDPIDILDKDSTTVYDPPLQINFVKVTLNER